MRARIDWSPDDGSLVSCIDGAVRIHDPQRLHPRREVAAQRVLDARWLQDGRIVAIDDRGWQQWTASGELVGQRHASDPRRAVVATLAAGGSHYVGVSESHRRMGTDVYVKSIDGERQWTLNAQAHGVVVNGRVSAALSGDGAVVAIGFSTRDVSDYTTTRSLDFVVIDLHSDAVVDRGAARMSNRYAELMLALDATGDRMVLSGTGESFGAIRIGRGDSYLRHDAAGAIAVALDDSGNLAAFGFTAIPEGARGRLRVDYLSHIADGTPTVEVVDTLSLEPALADIVALAFSRDSRNLACLASDGTIEVVPVP